MAAIPRYSLLVLPPEVLLLLRPHLCIASWTHLAQCSVALRQIFCVEEDLKKACFARGIAVPLRRAAWQPPRAASERPCFPNHRILCAKLAQHLRLCGLMACHDVCARSAGDALKDDAETGQTEALADTHELITLSKALKLEPKDRPIWSPIVQSLPIISYDSVKAAGIFTEEDDYLPGYRGANSSDVEPLFKHLPIMALHATTPPVERMTFYGSRSPWAATISNSGGCTVSDSVVLLVKAIGDTMRSCAHNHALRTLPITTRLSLMGQPVAVVKKEVKDYKRLVNDAMCTIEEALIGDHRYFEGFEQLDERLRCTAWFGS